MDLWELKLGDRIRTIEGAEAEVLSETEDGECIRARVLTSLENLSIVGR